MQTAQKRSGRPPVLSARDKGRFLRKFKSMREQTPNINVGLVAMECELHQVSTGTLSRILNKYGFKYVRPRRKGILTARDKKKESCLRNHGPITYYPYVLDRQCPAILRCSLISP